MTEFIRSQWLAFFAMLVLAMAPHTAHGADAPLKIGDYEHTSWTQKDGAPPGIWAMAQTRDGWLWLATSTGVYRFDGVSFERYDPTTRAGVDTSPSVTTFFLTRTDELWVLYSQGGATEIRVGDQDRSWSPPGLPEAIPVDAMEEDGDGRIWALVAGQFYGLDGARWQAMSHAQLGLPPLDIDDLFSDTTGTLWLFTQSNTYRMRKGQSRFERVENVVPKGRKGGVWRANDGLFWVFDKDSVTRLQAPDGPASTPAEDPSIAGISMPHIVDRRGTMWTVACADRMLCRYIGAASAKQTIPRAAFLSDSIDFHDRLLSSLPMTLLEDRQGNIWVGTKQGLDRFRPTVARTVEFPNPLIYFSTIADQGGALWLGTASEGLHDRWWHVTDAPRPWGDFDADATATLRDRDGGILIGGKAGLWRFDGEKFSAIELPPAVKGRKIQALARDGQGRLWVSFRASAVYQMDRGQWSLKGGLAGLPDMPALVAKADAKGRVWFGYAQNQLAVVDGTSVTRFTSADGLETGTITALDLDDPVLVGGESGVAGFDGRRFKLLRTRQKSLLEGVTGIVRAADGAYWFNGNAGAVRIAANDVLKAISDPSFPVPYRLFDGLDGLPGGAQQIRPLPSLTLGTDGRLWFSQTGGLAWIDPNEIQRDAAPPNVVIRSLQARHDIFRPGDGLRLAAQTRDLKIAYTALNALVPERVQFRYRLIGLDSTWQEAGTERMATYTNLGPGDYRFEVEAATTDGDWSPQPATLRFVIEPTFFQTGWFVGACIVLAVLLLLLLFLYRLRAVRIQVRQQLQERHAERDRIAREIHDTLLQGVQGLLLCLKAWASDASLNAAHRADLRDAADRAHEIMEEGRNRILDLRNYQATQQDLEFCLRFIGEEFASIHPAQFTVHSEGAERALAPCIGDEIRVIVREAIRNAFVHADAKHIAVLVRYERHHLRIDVVDDGVGIDLKKLKPHNVSGHWGIVGMEERARQMGSTISIRPANGKGTVVSLFVPGVVAFERSKRRWLRRAGIFRFR